MPKRARASAAAPAAATSDAGPAATASETGPVGLAVELEARACAAGNGIFARTALEPAWCWDDLPVTVPDGAGGRRLPHMANIDELMQEVIERAAAGEPRFAQLVAGPYAMSHVGRHLEAQGDPALVELPEWALATRTPAAEYNLLAARLQSNIARHHDGEGLILNPLIRLANHACDGNTDLAWVPPEAAAAASAREPPCEAGHYVLRARRAVRAGEELTYSYIGNHVLLEQSDLAERRALLLRRWGFECRCALCRAQMAVAAGAGAT